MSFSIIPRRDTAFLHIYSTNISIIHGASILLAVERVLDSIFKLGDLDSLLYKQNLYGNYVQLFCCGICMFVIISWPALEYFWFIILVQRRHTPVNTLIHYLLGVFQMTSAYLITAPRYFLFVAFADGIVALLCYVNILLDVYHANALDNPDELLISVKRTGWRGFITLMICLAVLSPIVWIVGVPGGDPLSPKSIMMTIAMILFAAILVTSITIIGLFADKVMKDAESKFRGP